MTALQSISIKSALNLFRGRRDSSVKGGPEQDEERILGLLDQVEQGDERAMAVLYKDFSRKVYAYALNRCHDPDEAEEIVIDTMHEVWKHPKRFRGESRFSTWLIGIARHKMLDAIRARQPLHADIADLEDVLASDDASAFDTIAQDELRAAIQGCMNRLSRDHRECLHLVFYQGMSLAEVAAVQRVPENTVKTRLFHARQKIKSCLTSVVRDQT